MLTLRRRNQGITVSQTKNDFQSWRDLHIVWLATDAWITARALMSFQPTPCMFRCNRLLRYLTERLGGIITKAAGGNCLHATCLQCKCLLTLAGSDDDDDTADTVVVPRDFTNQLHLHTASLSTNEYTQVRLQFPVAELDCVTMVTGKAWSEQPTVRGDISMLGCCPSRLLVLSQNRSV